jgi:2-polyprenyl-6-hydroxyphenyl methylase/3-demethylubiquinone-9 3-methyltransferase
MRSDLTVHDRMADRRWSDDNCWVRTLKSLVPGRLAWFDYQCDEQGRDVLDSSFAGGCKVEALAERWARGINCRLDLTMDPLPLTAIL